MKSKLAVFDFDHTIKYPNKGWKMGVSHFFPGGEIPEDLHQIRKEHGKICNSSQHAEWNLNKIEIILNGTFAV